MSCRCWLFVVPAFVWTLGFAPAHLAAQTPPAKKWTPPRTPDGQPDFQGNWNTATLTPLERPPEFAGKEFLTAQEAAEYEKRTARAGQQRSPRWRARG